MKKIFLGNTELKATENKVEGSFVELGNEKLYKISNYNQMPDFFMTIVSDSDHWMYLSSNGSLSAGRKNRDNALFPYYTVDKIHDYRGKTGSKTVCLLEKDNKTFLWEPFTSVSEKVHRIQRNIYKSTYGNKVIFEENNFDLGISFQYAWFNSDKFGWIKKSKLSNYGNSRLKVKVLDGIRNILPSGVDYAFQNEYSNLLDAYKKNELLEKSKLGLYMLSSIPVDRAEPSEALKATTVWSHVPNAESVYLVSDNQLEQFKQGNAVENEFDVRARRGAYYIASTYVLDKFELGEWYIVAEVNQDATAVANLNKFICETEDIAEQLETDVALGTKNLVKIVANADGLQLSKEDMGSARHFTNTLFNVMRGGIFANGYLIEQNDFFLFVKQCNIQVFKEFKVELEKLPAQVNYNDLLQWAREFKNPAIERITYEYLPLTFSRRHGDPSRPWNQFSIETKNDDGSDKLNYQGNWRDIFQNWEALSLSFPNYIEGIIAKFLNASTADGYNPYRITREGMDWECPDPEDPWAYIGYWGDHQIIYLQKFLEQSEQFNPGKLDELLSKEIFVYANVPYRIKAFNKLVENPKDTIVFDAEANSEIERFAQSIGADGKLLLHKNGEVIRTNLMEKVLNTLLSKLSNFIPEAGIWLNTQRPEWNDANNALVGNGVSMVTLYYLRRFIGFWVNKLEKLEVQDIAISEETKELLDKIHKLFADNVALCETGFNDSERYRMASALGEAGTNYREKIYAQSFSGKKGIVSTANLKEFLQVSLKFINQSIHKNKREDGLYHAYNLLAFNDENISIRYLYEMLEGQVAVLSSGALTPDESLNVLDSLKKSALFREDQYSYILYPNRQLARFIQKNQLKASVVEQSELLQRLLKDKSNTIISKDETGAYHFNGAFRNADVLSTALDKLSAAEYGPLFQHEKQLVLDAYEEMFDHQSFTGRSGTFYGYEGLGSIYWHMVSKLLLATQECYYEGIMKEVDAEILGRIKEHYYEIKAGIGVYKSPDLYGAFPTDAYSHTPENSGVKQPGLTGQVKEDVISRFGELGLQVNNGEIVFNVALLNANEILRQNQQFNYVDVEGQTQSIELKKGQIGFTFCQVPVVYTFGEEAQLRIYKAEGDCQTSSTAKVDAKTSASIFNRDGNIQKIEVAFQL